MSNGRAAGSAVSAGALPGVSRGGSADMVTSADHAARRRSTARRATGNDRAARLPRARPRWRRCSPAADGRRGRSPAVGGGDDRVAHDPLEVVEVLEGGRVAGVVVAVEPLGGRGEGAEPLEGDVAAGCELVAA